jgi:sugar transferase (PEP-CTERM/EpsH1 system associated)
MFESSLAASVIRQWGLTAQYSAALASSSGVARYVQPELLKTSGRVWIDLIDVDSQKWLDYAESSSTPMSLVYGLEGRRLRKLETQLAASSDRLLVVSEAERKLFLDFCSNAPVQAVGNGVDTEFFAPTGQHVKPFTCVFVGVLDYLPNSDAVRWFSKEVWPQVRHQFPAAEFRIVGRNPTSEVMALHRIPGVRVVGAVDDVRPWLNSSSCVVVPLRIARGIQNKVLEAMACGRPVICASAPLQGLSVEPGLHLLQADAPEEWRQQISLVFQDGHRSQELGVAAGAWVELNHRWNACLEPLIELTLQGFPSDRVPGFLNQPDP